LGYKYKIAFMIIPFPKTRENLKLYFNAAIITKIHDVQLLQL